MQNIDRREALKVAAYFLGGTISASLVAGVMSGCKTKNSEGAAGDTVGWKPSFLSAEQNRLVVEATERILPATDTPGAKAAKVNEFIDIILMDNYDEGQQKEFLAGLDALEADAKGQHNKSFADCSADQMDALLTNAMNGKSDAASFFNALKELTIVGFFTSEIGAKEVLNFQAIPGQWKGCVPLEETGGKTWAI